MIYKNLTAKELYASIPCTTTICQMMRDGIRQGSTQLAVSAMEELMQRGDTDLVAKNLLAANKEGGLAAGTSMSIMVAHSLTECHNDPFLRKAGDWMLQGNPFATFSSKHCEAKA